MDRVNSLQKAPRLRRPSISDQTSFLREDDNCTIRRSTLSRNSQIRSSTRISGLVTSTSGRDSTITGEGTDELRPLRDSKKESPKDYEKILSIQYMINFDQIFVDGCEECAYAVIYFSAGILSCWAAILVLASVRSRKPCKYLYILIYFLETRSN